MSTMPGGLEDILAEWPVAVYLGNGDFDLLPWKPAPASLKIPTDHHMIALGELTVECLVTPGHTPACMTYVIGDAAFVGDTLFMPDFGTARCDFPGGSSVLLSGRKSKRRRASPSVIASLSQAK